MSTRHPETGVWAGVRPGPVQHRGGGRLQHGRDGEQEPEHLQLTAGARLPHHRHRRGLLRHRGGGRARVLPQLDRQPRHLPGLVPAHPQGERNLVHSYFHNWTGNRATCQDNV
eukprot:600866-Prorocentrum_minimum.AAC.3